MPRTDASQLRADWLARVRVSSVPMSTNTPTRYAVSAERCQEADGELVM